ncbi:hypothetical protein ACPRNU_22460 [Chromobacterium vaccinii]|uniref:hypothetical protein n=1 Tax=Chromobacterium vaccinii TaxID=1108595 RepID=UPI003C776371
MPAVFEKALRHAKTIKYIWSEALKVIILIFAAVLMIQISFRAGNAMLIHDQAIVYTDPKLCSILRGAVEQGDCKIEADYSHDFISGDDVIRQKKAGGGYVVVQLPENKFRGAVITKSHWELHKNWY